MGSVGVSELLELHMDRLSTVGTCIGSVQSVHVSAQYSRWSRLRLLSASPSLSPHVKHLMYPLRIGL